MWEARGVALGLAMACVVCLPTAAQATERLPKRIANAEKGDVITVPAGVTLLKRPLELPSGVTLEGESARRSVLQIDPRYISRFSYNFAVRPEPGARNVTVRDLTIDGGLTPGAVMPPNAGGGLKAGDKWKISGVTFTDINYFKLWLYEISGTTAEDNTFTGTPGVTGQNDNIGGGRSRNLTIRDNTFTPTSTGSAIDILRSTRLTVSGNTLTGSDAGEKSLFLEGVTNSEVSGNTVRGGSITIKSDRGYTPFGDLTNPRGVMVTDNTVTDSPMAGITIIYTDAKRGATMGGANTIRGNTIRDAGRAGIVTVHCAATTDRPDVIADNRIDGAFIVPGAWNTGCGTVGPAGIGVTGGDGTSVTGNTIADTRGTLSAGLWFGTLDGDIPVTNPVEKANKVSPGLVKAHYVVR